MESPPKVEQNSVEFEKEDYSNGDSHAKFPYELKWVEESDTKRLLKDFLGNWKALPYGHYKNCPTRCYTN